MERKSWKWARALVTVLVCLMAVVLPAVQVAAANVAGPLVLHSEEQPGDEAPEDEDEDAEDEEDEDDAAGGQHKVKLNKSAVVLRAGDTVRLKASVLPRSENSQRVQWSSNKTAVATVDKDGRVEAVANGQAVITATAANGRKGRCTVYVGEPATGLELDQKSAKVVVGQVVRLKATVYPENAANKDVVYVSSDPEVARVGERGVVKALKRGRATITAMTLDQSRKAKFTLRVYQRPQSLQLNSRELALAPGKAKRLKASVEPSGALVGELVWKSNKPKIATVDDKGRVKALANGTAYITVTDERGVVKARCKVVVSKGGKSTGTGRVFSGRIQVTSSYQSIARPDHNGIDIKGLDSPRVYATVSGRVRYARMFPREAGGRTWEWGNFVWIEGDDGYNHIFAHMQDTPRVKEGSYIEAGTWLGVMGNTGYSFGVHTHYEVRKPSGETVDPAPFTGIQNAPGVYG